MKDITLPKVKKLFETIIFQSGYVALSFYLIVLLALFVYAFFNVKEFAHYLFSINKIDSRAAMLVLVELIDMGMIAGFSVMMIKGSYNSFVSKTHGYVGENVSSGLLKTKMTTSLVNIIGVSILQKAVLIGDITNGTPWEILLKLGFVYMLFLISSIVLQGVDYMHMKSECLYVHHPNEETNCKQELH